MLLKLLPLLRRAVLVARDEAAITYHHNTMATAVAQGERHTQWRNRALAD